MCGSGTKNPGKTQNEMYIGIFSGGGYGTAVVCVRRCVAGEKLSAGGDSYAAFFVRCGCVEL